jgi:hypothetical protein
MAILYLNSYNLGEPKSLLHAMHVISCPATAANLYYLRDPELLTTAVPQLKHSEIAGRGRRLLAQGGSS